MRIDSADLRALALKLGGEVSCGQVLCPGPGHSPKDRSLAVKFNGDRLLVHSFASDDSIACLAYVRDKLGVARPERTPSPSRPKPSNTSEHQQHAKARWLWGRREPLIGSVAERYLREARGYGGPLPPTLAFLRAYRDHPPALICAFALPEESEPGILAPPRDVNAVQLIALRLDGSKADKADVKDGIVKRTIGARKGLPIIISPPNDGLGLSIHEGVEDALTAYEATGLGCWASAGAGFLPALADAVPSFIKCITIVGHNDDAGRVGARALAHCLNEKGVEVLLNGDTADGRS